MKLSSVATTVPQSGIRQVVEIIERSEHLGDVIRLEIGEPSFPTPDHIVRAADAAARAGRTRMTAAAGLPRLRSALADRMSQRTGATISSDQVLVTHGSTQALYLALVALLEPGDEVLIPDPGYPSYTGIVLAAHGTAVRYRLTAANGFAPDPTELEDLLTPRTRVIVVNSPNNPTGTVIDRVVLQQLLDLAERHDLVLLADEVYDEIVFDGVAVSPWALDHHDRVISAFSLSKTYAMTGWRLGYAVAPLVASGPLARVHGSMMSCLSTPLQWAGLEAITGPQIAVAEMREVYRHRRDIALDRLTGTGLVAHPPAGAFYLWLDISPSGTSGDRFAWSLLEHQRVAVAPGTAFGPGGRDFVRLSLAADSDRLAEGISRIVRHVADCREVGEGLTEVTSPSIV